MSDDPIENSTIDVSSITYLIRRTRAGCDDSRSRVLAKLEPFLVSMAGRLSDSNLKSKEGVSDIVQNSFVRVVENFDSFHGTCGAELRGWLKVLVLNEVRQIGRKWHGANRDVKRENTLEPERANLKVHGRTDNPIAAMIQSERLAELKVALSKLREVEQTIIRLKTSEGLSLPQIAKQMDRSLAATSKTYYRALIRLQKLLEVERE